MSDFLLGMLVVGAIWYGVQWIDVIWDWWLGLIRWNGGPRNAQQITDEALRVVDRRAARPECRPADSGAVAETERRHHGEATAPRASGYGQTTSIWSTERVTKGPWGPH